MQMESDKTMSMEEDSTVVLSKIKHYFGRENKAHKTMFYYIARYYDICKCIKNKKKKMKGVFPLGQAFKPTVVWN